MDTAATADTPVVNLHFLDYWRVIRLRKSLILTVFLLCVITSSVLDLLSAQAVFQHRQNRGPERRTEVTIWATKSSSPELGPYYLTTQFESSPPGRILYQVITNMDLQHVLAEQDDRGRRIGPWTRPTPFLSRKVAVDQTRGTSLIEITVTKSHPELAATSPTDVADVYKQYRADRGPDPTPTALRA